MADGAGKVPAGGGGGRTGASSEEAGVRAAAGAAFLRLRQAPVDATAASRTIHNFFRCDTRACRTKTTVLFRASRIARRERFSMKRLPTVYHLVLPLAVAMLAPGGLRVAHGQGQAMPPIKVDLPPPPNFNIQTAPEKYPSGEMSIYGVRKHMSQYLDKDVQIKAYLLQIYECPAEQRKCNEELAAKAKKEKVKEMKAAKGGGAAPAKGGAAPAPAAAAAGGSNACRPCDQPHF